MALFDITKKIGGTDMESTTDHLKLKWYEKLLAIPYLAFGLTLGFIANLLDGTYSKASKEDSLRFDEGLRRTNELFNRYKNLTANEILAELQSIHKEARVILAVPIYDWGYGFYELICRVCEDPTLTSQHAELLVEMTGWEEFRDYAHDNSARMELLLTAQRLGLTQKMLPTLQSLLKFVQDQDIPMGTHNYADRACELKILTEMINTLQPPTSQSQEVLP